MERIAGSPRSRGSNCKKYYNYSVKNIQQNIVDICRLCKIRVQKQGVAFIDKRSAPNISVSVVRGRDVLR